MPSFDHTVDLERALLKSLLVSSMMSRMYMHRVTEEWFTSNERKFVYSLARDILRNTKSVLTKTVFEYEVTSKIAEGDRTYYVSEWNIIESDSTSEPPEALIEKMKEARLGRRAMGVAEEVVGFLENGRISDAVAHLKKEAMSIGSMGEDRPMVEVTDIQTRLAVILDKRLHPEKYRGLKTGWPTFDYYTGGLFPGELTLLAGITGTGKSTLCKQLAKNIAILNGKNVLHIANEEYLEQVEHKYDALHTGIPYSNFKLATITDEDIEKWKGVMTAEMKVAGIGRIFVKEVPAFTDVSLIEQAYRQLENQGIHIHVIIIDHLPHVKPIQQAWGENDERSKAASDCKELGRWLRVAVVVPTQAATDVEEKTTKGRRAGKLDVYGSKGQIHVANTFLIIMEKGKDDTQTGPDDEKDTYLSADVKKNRDGATFCFRLRHFVKSGRIEEVINAKSVTKSGVNEVLEEAKPDGKKEEPASVVTPEVAGDVVSEEQAEIPAAANSMAERAISEGGVSPPSKPVGPEPVKPEPVKRTSILDRWRARKIS